MKVLEEYKAYRRREGLNPSRFQDRIILQLFLRDRVEAIWREKPRLSHGGLFRNHMTGLAMGFAYYDCRPTGFCRERCYGLALSGIFDYHMLRLAVLTSESLKRRDPRYLRPLHRTLGSLSHLKVGHWGDAVPEQLPALMDLVLHHPRVVFWWYTRKEEIARLGNELGLPNLRVYLSLDPTSPIPPRERYPHGFTYLFSASVPHPREKEILGDSRLVALFGLKRWGRMETHMDHPKMCPESLLKRGDKGELICLRCQGRCNYNPL